MREVIRSRRGHLYLWIWGATWVIMPMLAQFGSERLARFFPIVCFVAGALTAVVGFQQARQIRAPIDRRLLALLAAIVAFAAVMPFITSAVWTVRAIYTYICLVSMQCYIIAGLWTDTYLLWLGIIVSGLLLIGHFLPPPFYWPWMAVCGGGALILTGFYVRHAWR